MVVLEKGEAQIEVAGRVYTLKVGHGMFRQLETMFPGRTITEIFDLAIKRNSYIYGAGVIHAMLKKYHPQMTTDDVDQLIDDAGGLASLDAQIGALMSQMQPLKEDLQAIGANPPKAQAGRGTGKRSRVKPDGSA